MRRFSIEIDVPAPPERAWAVMSDVERWHEWTPSITRVSLLRGKTLQPGSRAFVRQPRLPPALWKVTQLEPGRCFTWVSGGPGFRAVGTHAVAPAPGGTRVHLAIEYQGVLGGLFGRLTAALTNRYLEYEANGLKRRSLDPAFRLAG